MTQIAIYKNRTNSKVVRIMKVIKAGTKRIFFFPLTENDKRLNSTLYAKLYDAVALGKVYLIN